MRQLVPRVNNIAHISDDIIAQEEHPQVETMAPAMGCGLPADEIDQSLELSSVTLFPGATIHIHLAFDDAMDPFNSK